MSTSLSRHSRLSAVVVTATTLATAVALTLTAVGAAQGRARTGALAARPSASRAMTHVVATGLNNPRQLSFDRAGRLFVAEAGKGGKGPCFKGGDGTVQCYGTTGSISRVEGRLTHRVVRGLPSLAGKGGTSAIGPSDLILGPRGHYTLSIGLGNNPATRAKLPRSGRFMDTLSTGRLGHRSIHVLANLGHFEATHDPDHAGPDSDPVGFVRGRGGFVLTDAGGNDLLRVGPGGAVRTLAVFGTRKEPSPFGGPDIDMQAVPTSVVRGPDGAFYISQLTGFPFPVGAARIYRWVPGHAPRIFARGLTNVTDLAWRGHRLYAVQIADHGLLAPGVPIGSLVRVRPGHTAMTVAHLRAPYGVAIRGGSAYVSTCTVCRGTGKVVRIQLP